MTRTDGLTRKQQQVLNFIKSSIQRRGYPPSVREIGEALGIKSTSTVHAYLSRLERKGYIRRDPSKPRAIGVVDEPPTGPRAAVVPLVGRVTAGQPILALQNIEDVFPVPAHLVPDGEAFALRVRGDSMVGAGILDGDYVIVRRQSVAENGDIVVALLDDEATVKRFYRERDRIRLQPENPKHQPIYARHVRILGKVVALLRRLP